MTERRTFQIANHSVMIESDGDVWITDHDERQETVIVPIQELQAIVAEWITTFGEIPPLHDKERE